MELETQDVTEQHPIRPPCVAHKTLTPGTGVTPKVFSAHSLHLLYRWWCPASIQYWLLWCIKAHRHAKWTAWSWEPVRLSVGARMVMLDVVELSFSRISSPLLNKLPG